MTTRWPVISVQCIQRLKSEIQTNIASNTGARSQTKNALLTGQVANRAVVMDPATAGDPTHENNVGCFRGLPSRGEHTGNLRGQTQETNPFRGLPYVPIREMEAASDWAGIAPTSPHCYRGIDNPMNLDGSCYEMTVMDKRAHPAVAPEASGMAAGVVTGLYSSLKVVGATKKIRIELVSWRDSSFSQGVAQQT